MRSKEKGGRPKTSSSQGPGGPRLGHVIASITSRNSPARQAYDRLGLRPTVPEMQAGNTPGIELAGKMVCGLVRAGAANGKLAAITENFCDNHPDVIERLGGASGLQ